jgi:hypothetical protein
MTYRIVVQNVGLRLHLILRERVEFIRSHWCKILLKINLRLIKDFEDKKQQNINKAVTQFPQ